jgi:tRNA-(ms[2]io[6]A)-hydroxylase
MISSLIEARSCERFALLGEACDDDPELKKLYKGLWASEHGHYRTFIQLAEQLQPAEEVEKRWQQMLAGEADIIRQQSPGPRMHSGAEGAEEERRHEGTQARRGEGMREGVE